MKKNKYLLLISSLGVSALLIWAAIDENYLRDWRRIQSSALAAGDAGEIHLRQIVVPALRTTDRCVSCHIGMAPGANSVAVNSLLAPHPRIAHDPGQYGCTPCHGGQGRATEKADAHGDSPFWPEPMLPRPYTSAGCGTCHNHARVPDLAGLEAGERQLERADCLACHRIDGRGGTQRPGGAGGMEGPDLSQVGAGGWRTDWYERHLDQQQRATSGAWKTSFGPLEPAARAQLEQFLATRVGAPDLMQAKALFHSLGCRGCHKVHGVGGDDGPDLSLVGMKDVHRLDCTHVSGAHTLPNWLAAHSRWPARIVPGSKMPVLGLSDDQIDQLTLYMLSLRDSEFPEAFWPTDRVRINRLGDREFAADGRTLYQTFCTACHGDAGNGQRFPDNPPFPAIGHADFLAVASDAFLVRTITEGRPGRRMPAWNETAGGLRDDEIARIVQHMRGLSGTAAPVDPRPERRWVQADAAAGQAKYATLCAGCHGSQGEGTQAPELRNASFLAAASDTYLVETLRRGRSGTPMPGFARGSTTFPALSPQDIESIVAFIRTWEDKGP
jgi:cytochrome c oxidase cbb3-type subunit 3